MLSYAENKRTWPAIVSQKSLAASEWFQFVLSRLRSNFQCEHAGSIQSSCPSAACFDCHAFAEQAGTILQSTEHRANGVGLGLLACLSSHISISNAENGFVRKPTPTSLASPAGHDQFVKLEHAQMEFQLISFCIQVGYLWSEEFRVELVHAGASKR